MLRTSILAIAILALAGLMPMATVSAASQTTAFSKTVTFEHITITTSGSIVVDTTAKTITGTITVKAVNDTTGQTIFQKTVMFGFNFAFMGTTNFVLMIPTINLLLAASCNIDISANSSSCIVSKSPDVAGQGVVNMVDVSTIAIGFGSSNSSCDLNGDGICDIQDVAIVAYDFGAPVFW